MFQDLTNLLHAEDKETIAHFIKFHCGKEVKDIDHILRFWGKEKRKLYKLLGNRFTYEFDLPDNSKEAHNELTQHLYNGHYINDLKAMFSYLFDGLYRTKEGKYVCMASKKILSTALDDERYADELHRLNYVPNYLPALVREGMLEQRITKPIDFDYYYKDKFGEIKVKSVHIDAGAKPMRVLTTLLKLCKPYMPEEEYKYCSKKKEDIAIEYSKLLNEVNAGGKVCVSIHPIDFLSMSVNSNNWSSCLNLAKGGYRQGAAEMMNSNCVVVAYIKSNTTDYTFDNDKCNNKKWRQLFVVNKDIICCGKAYPYTNNTLSKYILDLLKDLAKENWNVTYDYGPQPYADTINSLSTLGRTQFTRNQKKIVFATTAMYNDWDQQSSEYYCYRNKVKRSYVLSISGKSECLCCGKEINPHFRIKHPDWRTRPPRHNTVYCLDCI